MEKTTVTTAAPGDENEVPIAKAIKKPDDIKSYAESTMNELLGWYGYETPRSEGKRQRHSRSFSGSNDSEAESLKFTEGCGWCGKAVDEGTSVISATAVFCSELCFSQSRRASFKRNKTCDWCRHARHTVSYVDFQDNAAQLQFCSDKCLNQYKMHIFCRETQAHLELHPHLHGADTSTNTSAGLITPDLWLRNCNTSSPPPRSSSHSRSSPEQHIDKPVILEPHPLISVAPNSKLLGSDAKKLRQRASKRINKKQGCTSTITSSPPPFPFAASDIPQDLRVRQTPPLNDIDDNRNSTISSATPPQPPLINDDSSRSRLTAESIRALLGNILPPPTTFVPYPVILPLPIPIPIPIPIPKMFKSNDGKEVSEIKDCQTQTEEVVSKKDTIERVKMTEDEEVVIGKKVLRKRKQVTEERKPKVFIKHKKTLATLP